MPRMIFVNLPVADLPRARAFYEAVGFTNDARFTDETAACMVLSEAIHVMLLTHDKFRQFTTKSIAGPGTVEVLNCVSTGSRADVDATLDKVAAGGGTADSAPVQDHGWMYCRAFEDPDGHTWEVMYMDVVAAEKMFAGQAKPVPA